MKSLLTLLFVFLLSSCSNAKPLPTPIDPTEDPLQKLNTGKEVLRVNDQILNEGYLDLIAKMNPRVEAQLANPRGKKQVLESIIDQEVLYQESLKHGLHLNPDVLAKAALFKKVIIAQAFVEQEVKKEAKKYYDQNKNKEFKKVHVSHIQIDFIKNLTEEQKKSKTKLAPTQQEKNNTLTKVKQIKARLVAGEDFKKVAEEVSNDEGTKKSGGDLGEISIDDKRLAKRGMTKIAEVAFKLKKGKISDPIETKKGYHLIMVTTEPEIVPFEKAEKMIQFQIQKQVKEDLIAKLKKEAKIKEFEVIQEAPTTPTEQKTPVIQKKPEPQKEPEKKEPLNFKSDLKIEEKDVSH